MPKFDVIDLLVSNSDMRFCDSHAMQRKLQSNHIKSNCIATVKCLVKIWHLAYCLIAVNSFGRDLYNNVHHRYQMILEAQKCLNSIQFFFLPIS